MPDSLFKIKSTTVRLDVSTTSDRVLLSKLFSDGSDLTLRIFNAGTYPAFIELGGNTVVATVGTNKGAGSFPVAPGRETGISVQGSAKTYLAAICDTGGTAKLFITVGEGI